MTKHILIFGGGGFIGGNIASVAKAEGWQVCIAGRAYRPGVEGASWKIVDITEKDAVDWIVEEVKPDAVVNAAAIASIDRAEREQELAWQVNVEGAKHIAEICAKRGIKYVFFSSGAVFDGKGSMYTEEDELDPVNYYGYTKAEAERVVLEAHPGAVVIRISLVMGFPVTGGNSFFADLETKLKGGEKILCPTDEVRTPVDVITLSECVLELAENDFSGVLHVGSTDSISRYDLTKKLVKRMSFDESVVVPLDSHESRSGRAPRHKNGIISVSKAQKVLGTRLFSVDEGIDRAFRERIHPGRCDSMIQPEIKHELAVAYGSIYGFEETLAVIECLKNLAPSCGKKVKQFENAFAEYCGIRYALAVTSATTGLTLAGTAAGIGPGDEVITTPISWVATAMAFSALGADIVFCDVDPRTLNLDPDKLEEKITPKTKAIVPVHLYGQCCEMDRIKEIADRHGIAVIEDCAHNPGGEYAGKKSGSLGHMGIFSFHQQKHLSTLGEGGMITTDSKEFFERALSYRSLCCRIYGESDKYLSIDEDKHPMGREYWKLFFDDIGYNFRMTDAQAAVGIEQLKKLDKHNDRRIELADRLNEKLDGVRGLTLPYVDPKGKHVFHLYMVQVEKDFPMSKRDFMWELYTKKGIKAWSHYMLIHLTHPYRARGHGEGECPVAEAAFEKYVTLPLHPRLTFEAIDYMADCVRELA